MAPIGATTPELCAEIEDDSSEFAGLPTVGLPFLILKILQNISIGAKGKGMSAACCKRTKQRNIGAAPSPGYPIAIQT